jgi:hypothetical protein
MDEQVKFSIILKTPPAGVDYGLQKGAGNKYETVQTQRSTAKDLQFEFTAMVKRSEGASAPDFRGPFVQGPVNGRFVYIDIGTYAGQQKTEWSRRLKIPLSGISFEMIDKLLNSTAAILKTSVPGTGKDGGPNCATVKPFDGWSINKV